MVDLSFPEATVRLRMECRYYTILHRQAHLRNTSSVFAHLPTADAMLGRYYNSASKSAGSLPYDFIITLNK